MEFLDGILFGFGNNFINKEDSKKFRMADYLSAMQCVRPKNKLIHYKFSQFDIFNPINDANDLRIVAEILKSIDINSKDKDEIIRSADLFDKYGVFLYFKQPVFYKNGTARQNYECHLELLGNYGDYATRNRPPRCIMNRFMRVLEKCGDWIGGCNSDIARFKLADSKITTKEEYEENKRKLIENIEGLGFKIFTNI